MKIILKQDVKTSAEASFFAMRHAPPFLLFLMNSAAR